MRNQLALATTTALAMMLSACGGADDDAPEISPIDEVVTAEPADEAAVTGDTEAAEMTEEQADAAEDADADDAEDSAPEPVASASATPKPTPTPRATPTQVASMEPPAAFTTCGVCHAVEPGKNMIGPSLAGVVGRKAGTVSGANYSPAMKSANLTWNEANLRRYLRDPGAVVPGGTMPNPGLDAAQTQAIVNYLKTL
ncbi:c-type cytochrome [Aurantiacibacter rhizosphaerae]|uniref:C-type cytochrome n=1 Tax=Aurantiacibacter rhizosphaerae TaxID=2691582 RepID=A0A844XFR1_9SPHN|nr:c-type cytochrome [Aurantiacibacter rhizosphaerae]MWV28836.1 c-type cytochrome [Aurantiacibacter rhizosphaerae]